MQHSFFRRIDTLMGWAAFAIAATVYGTTVEPTASLWDCPEFITSGYKQEIGHPPGAPFYMLTANLFAQLASDPSQVAFMVNMLSALLSAGCILLLFYTTTHFARRLIAPDGNFTPGRVVLIEACGMVGAMAYAFSDTFWFSATEAEVYAYSSFLTALVFWLMLKWEDEAPGTQADRWIILISYVVGLSIGVHLLNLLCIPAMVLVFYFRRTEKTNLWGVCRALMAGCALVAAVLYGIIPGTVWLAGCFELLFVNGMGCPYHSGLLCLILLLFVAFGVALYLVRRRMFRITLMSVLMLLVGYSCYGVILIRASAQPPMNENAADNVFALRSYLAREQYGDTPLLHGPAYTSNVAYERQGNYMVAKYEDGGPVYRPSADTSAVHYDVVRHKREYLFAENMWFPRMHSHRHSSHYESWLGGVEKKGGLPTMAENLRFFLSYQVNFMYWRYFLWNFVGRQNDIQGHGEVEHGNWITGIDAVDSFLLGCDASRLPSALRNNPGRNVYFGLPLLLGLLGLYWQLGKGTSGRRQAFVLGVFFFMTGLAIVLYLNQTPAQARERDYAYAGSFYAFAVWIGLGVAGMEAFLRNLCRNGHAATGLAALVCTAVPLQMLSQTWDDHDRSGRYACRDFGRNYLESLPAEGNPVILCNGDNDTFPLWYTQEVEGKRTDTRACNLQYACTDWYIDQLQRPANLSPALPLGWEHNQYREGTREQIPVRPELKQKIMDLYSENPEQMKTMLGEQPFELGNVMQNWVFAENPDMQCIPTDSVTLAPAGGMPQMTLSFAGVENLHKSDLVVLGMLARLGWERPLYLSVSVNMDEVPYLRGHLVQEGLAYRVSPQAQGEEMDVERTYDCVMKRFRYGGLDSGSVYADEHVLHLVYTHQRMMGRLIDELLAGGDTERALAVAEKWQRVFPARNVPRNELSLAVVEAFYAAGKTEQGDTWLESLLCNADEWLAWLGTVRDGRRQASAHSAYRQLHIMQRSLLLAKQYQRARFLNDFTSKWMDYATQYKTL